MSPDDEQTIVTATPASVPAQAPPPSEPSAPLVAGRYEVLGLVGAGAMGLVYRARDTELDELVALKLLRRDAVATATMLERFRREVKLARRVTHRNVARVFDIGRHEGARFLTMELVEGESLAALLSREGPLPVERVVEIARYVCIGLTAAHEAGVIHRDLKPDNVLIERGGRVVLTDFGIARAALEVGKQTRTHGLAVGTPAYMSPEQAEGRRDIDERADLYALGATLYKLLTGQPPFKGDSPTDVLAEKLVEPPPDPMVLRPDLPASLGALIRSCLAPKREERPASAIEVGAELARIAERDLLDERTDPMRISLTSPMIEIEDAGEDLPIAVLPMRGGGSPDDDYLAEGLAELVAEGLSHISRVVLVAAREAARAAETNGDPRDAGRELGAQLVVEGSVRRVSDAVRVSVRLLSVADGFQLWTRRADVTPGGIVRLGAELARGIASALSLAVPDEPPRTRPDDDVALDLFMRARHEQRRTSGDDDDSIALGLFEQALRRVPEHPRILASYALARARRPLPLGNRAGLSSWVARQTAERALAVDARLPEARLALALVLIDDGDSATAVRHLRHVLKHAPRSVDAHEAVGALLCESGRTVDGMRHLEAAASIDPHRAMPHLWLARARSLGGDWGAAEAEHRRAAVSPALQPMVWLSESRLALWCGDARWASAHRVDLSPHGEALELACVCLDTLLRARVPDESRARLLAMTKRSEGEHRRWTIATEVWAETLLWSGEREAALHAIAQACADGLGDLAWLDGCPLLAKIRPDSRFADVRAEVARRAIGVVEAYLEPPV